MTLMVFVKEVSFIQSKLIYQNSPTSIEGMAKKFNNFLLSGKVNAALRLLSELVNKPLIFSKKKIL